MFNRACFLRKAVLAVALVSGGTVALVAVPQQSAAQESATDRSRLDALTWRGASAANTVQAYKAYLAEFPEGLFADLAQQKLQELNAVPNTSRQGFVAESNAQSSGFTASGTSAAPEPEKPSPEPEAGNSIERSVPPASDVAESTQDAIEPASDEPVELERAYVAPSPPRKPLPALPETPVLAEGGYPECRESYQERVSPFDKIDSINRCTVQIDVYYEDTLNVYRERMIAHQNELSEVYTTKVANKVEYAGKRHDAFYDAMMKEHAASNPDGEHLAYYREMETKYQADRAYLEDQYCRNAGCNGYEAPDFDYALKEKKEKKAARAEEKREKKKKKRKSAGKKKCRAARAGGGLLGGLIGGLGGKALGLGKAGQLIAGGVGAIVGSELACQLTKKEQEVAAEATVEIVEIEEVGATAEWISPERKGVSGSSTITALNTEPTGATCLDITDVAIIDGEETSISKRMCRAPGQSRYTLMA